NNCVCHAGPPAEPAAHIACVVVAPGLAARVEPYPAELIDLSPTVCGLLGCPPHPNFQGIDLFAKDRPAEDERLVFCHVETGIGRVESVWLGGRWKLMHDRKTTLEYLYDITNDPGETTNL